MLDLFWVHETSVERKTGFGPAGPVLASAVAVTGFVEQTSKLIRDDSGVEVVSTATVRYPPGTPVIPAGSFVTIPAVFGAARAEVIACAVHDAGGIDLPEHVEVSLT